ncbi:Membrane protein with 6 predicted TMS [Lactiplantibacillus plantarum]|nr:Membrane protein with 6 predicted TMS [Lactiplantibacillus plantarum]
MCVFVADMAWYNLTIPLAAMSMATESFDYSNTWWKKYIYYNASIISQVLCMSLSVWCFTNMAKYGFIAFIASIGFGFLVVKTPDAVKDFWASTGVTKSTGMGAMRMFQIISVTTRRKNSYEKKSHTGYWKKPKKICEPILLQHLHGGLVVLLF